MQKLPVITFDRSVNTTCPVTAVRSIGGYAWGKAAADYIVENIPKGGKVLVLRTAPGLDIFETRWAAAEQTFNDAGVEIVGTEFVGGDRAKTKATVVDYLSRNGKIDAVWVDLGVVSVAVAEAFEDLGVDYPVITGEDEQDYLQAWQKKGFKGIAPTYPAFQWRTAVLAALNVLQGEPVPSPEWILPQPVITQADLSKYTNESCRPCISRHAVVKACPAIQSAGEAKVRFSIPSKIDYLILGGGSAGCALAARLSEDADFNIVLIEAGRDLRKATMPDNIRSRYPGLAYLDPNNIWTALKAVYGCARNGTPNASARTYEQARVLGGGSAINAMVANRGSPEDYDEWGALGAEGWSGEIALKYFRKIERDVDFDNEYHGQQGPIVVRRLPNDKISPFVSAVKETLHAQGQPVLPDQNGKWQDGIFPAAIAVSDDGERIPASIAYLTEEVRRRPNLTIVTDAFVRVLHFLDKRVIGAEIERSGKREVLFANETIVAMGGIHSAALLLRSGIGPQDELKPLGIEVRNHLPGSAKPDGTSHDCCFNLFAGSIAYARYERASRSGAFALDVKHPQCPDR